MTSVRTCLTLRPFRDCYLYKLDMVRWRVLSCHLRSVDFLHESWQDLHSYLTRSQTRLQNAGVQANAKMPSWAQQPPLDLGPLPSLNGDLDKREDIPLPTTAQGKSPLVINGTEVKCEITGWKQFGLNGKQFVLQEGPLMVARFQLVAGSKITVPSILNIPKISAKPKKNKKDRDADKVAGVQEKQAAYVYGVAFKDEKNEGPKVLLTNIKANSSSVLPGMTDPPAGNSSQRSQVSSRLNHRGTYMTLRAAAKINSRHKSLTSKNLHGEQAWARRRRRTRAKTKKKKMGDADAQDEQKFRFIEQQINETQEALRKYMTERNVAKAYAKGLLMKKIKTNQPDIWRVTERNRGFRAKIEYSRRARTVGRHRASRLAAEEVEELEGLLSFTLCLKVLFFFLLFVFIL